MGVAAARVTLQPPEHIKSLQAQLPAAGIDDHDATISPSMGDFAWYRRPVHCHRLRPYSCRLAQYLLVPSFVHSKAEDYRHRIRVLPIQARPGFLIVETQQRAAASLHRHPSGPQRIGTSAATAKGAPDL